MKTNNRSWKRAWMVGGACAVLIAGLGSMVNFGREAKAGVWPWKGCRHGGPCHGKAWFCPDDGCGEFEGTWYWLRSPEQEKRVVAGLYNRYCIRCHGVDGRGVWDIPDVPNFANARWQASRSDAQLARAIVEGRGAVMPAFRGALTLEESWAMARYLRTFIPGSEASRPEEAPMPKPGEQLPAPKAASPEASAKPPATPVSRQR